MKGNFAAENGMPASTLKHNILTPGCSVLGTIGTILWTCQIIPQVNSTTSSFSRSNTLLNICSSRTDMEELEGEVNRGLVWPANVGDMN